MPLAYDLKERSERLGVMGHSSKKKKKRSRGRAPAKDHSSLSAEDQELLAEELTAL